MTNRTALDTLSIDLPNERYFHIELRCQHKLSIGVAQWNFYFIFFYFIFESQTFIALLHFRKE